jgi:hypothetical protein
MRLPKHLSSRWLQRVLSIVISQRLGIHLCRKPDAYLPDVSGLSLSAFSELGRVVAHSLWDWNVECSSEGADQAQSIAAE